MILTEKDQARFWAKVALPDGNGCMLWLASRWAVGYGRFGLSGSSVRAHRVSYQLAHGSIPDGLVLDHLCRVRHCVAPEHLEAVTVGENTRRGIGPGAHNSEKTHCPQEHPYGEANLYVTPRGDRRCRTCAEAH